MSNPSELAREEEEAAELNEFQKIAIQSYANGEYSYITTRDKAGAAVLGDPLVPFILGELDDAEDSEEAVKRVVKATQDLLDVAAALVKARYYQERRLNF